ncbi:hypothetical protein BJX70DRAFT_405367 [Aspergillus crustosus]
MKPLPLAAIVPLAAALWYAPGVAGVANGTNDAVNNYFASLSVKTATQPVSGRPTDQASALEAVLSGKYSRLHHQRRDECPVDCTLVGTNTSAWYRYGSLDRLDRACNKPLLLDFALSNNVDDEESIVAISACTADYTGVTGSNSDATCARPDVDQARRTSSLRRVSSGPSSPERVDQVVTALGNLRGFTLSDAGCNETIKFAYSRDVAVGVYGGSGLAGQGVLGTALGNLIRQIQEAGSVAESVAVELCGNSTARYTLGIAIDGTGDLGAVQHAVQGWKNGTCTSNPQARAAVSNLGPVSYLAPVVSNSTVSNSAKRAWRRDECRTIQVEGGDECPTLAVECGITPAQFTEYNPGATFCGDLRAGQHVCCSEGTLPDFRPQPDEDGYCFSYLVVTGDDCSQLGAANQLTNEEIEEFNQDTWGWNGCDNVFADYAICLSPGYPPMPPSLPNAVCGPQVNDTVKAPPGTDLSTLNQCPLNACCNIWGQCGTTGDFCIESESPTGAPGTAAPGENGCISNCGMDIIIGDTPADNYNIAYFEAWSWERACLRMTVTSIDTSVYTHIHYSFIELNEDFSINIDKVADQFQLFLGMTGIKKIVALGGWAFSTEPDTYHILRNAVATAANRATLVRNIIDFLEEYNLDGIDWDWEYPAEPDIPGIPPGHEDEATGFFLLLNELYNAIPEGKTSSVTGPASFWYLQYFPIDAIAQVTDYLVFMTYDLHGQWDYINKYATPGCPSYDSELGNCLRSHINITETLNSLSMVTKAGVPSHRTIVGVSSYGRSFEMTTPGCWTEQCTYTGPESGAFPGRCTETPGYISDFEIAEILRTNPTAQDLWDEDSQSDIVVFNGTQWAAYMKPENKENREALYPTLNFLGTADWAVDLQGEFGGGSGGGGNDGSDGGTYYVDPAIWDEADPVVVAPPGASLIWPPKPLATPTTITFEPWTTSITYSALTTRTSTLPGGAVTTIRVFDVASWLTVVTLPPVTTTAIPVWGVWVDSSSTEAAVITLTSSVQPPPLTVIVTPVISGTTSIIGATETTTITREPIIWGSTTYTPAPETRTLGGTTTIIGGTTQPPTQITVTPNPHPTETPDPDDDDDDDGGLNIIPPTYSPGDTPSPTAQPGCPGCGNPCLLFCNPDCPFCPPGVFGPPGGGGGNNNDDNDDNDDDDDDDDDDDEDDEDDEDEQTIIYASMSGDAFPTGFPSDAQLTAADEDVMSYLSEHFDLTTTTTTTRTTTTRTTTTTTTTRTPDPTPTADCDFWDTILFYTFQIYNIDNWAEEDGGDALEEEERGCGAIARWDWHDETDDEYAWVEFTLPFFMAAGCVERAIVSAGGPRLECDGQGIGPTKRRLEIGDDLSPVLEIRDGDDRKLRTSPVRPVFSEELMEQCRAFYRDLNEEHGYSIQQVENHEPYVPMVWEDAVPEITPAARL